MSKEAGQFVYMTCKAGAEAALKQENARTQPEWRLAFSRPGFLTFKQGGGAILGDKELAERSWTFAHAHGVSLGRLNGSQLAELVQNFWQHEGVLASVNEKAALDIHVWQ